jgi:hypothetical protein
MPVGKYGRHVIEVGLSTPTGLVVKVLGRNPAFRLISQAIVL